jgi:hypothetical protein
MEKHILQTNNKYGEIDLTSTNILLEKQREIENQVARVKQVEELEQQANKLKENEPDK